MFLLSIGAVATCTQKIAYFFFHYKILKRYAYAKGYSNLTDNFAITKLTISKISASKLNVRLIHSLLGSSRCKDIPPSMETTPCSICSLSFLLQINKLSLIPILWFGLFLPFLQNRWTNNNKGFKVQLYPAIHRLILADKACTGSNKS